MRPQYILPKYEIVGPRDCWVVIGQSRNREGYVRIRRDGKLQQAHRWVYEQMIGPIPEGLDLDHTCRTRACINPYHMEPVTEAENSRRGIRTKLSPEQVAEIRALAQSLTPSEIALIYGVTKSTICDIQSNRRWVSDVPDVHPDLVTEILIQHKERKVAFLMQEISKLRESLATA